MKIKIKLRLTGDDGGMLTEDDVLTLEKGHHRVEDVGLSLAEAKDLLARLQERVVAAQATIFAAEHRHCPCCHRRLRKKGHYPMTFRTPFGDVAIASPRFRHCGCRPTNAKTFSPLNALVTSHVAPEMLYLRRNGPRWCPTA